MPSFENIWQEYNEKGVVFLGVAISDFYRPAKEFADETGVTYPMGVDEENQIGDIYGVRVMPTTYIIDRDGIIDRRLQDQANEGALRIFLGGQLKQN